MILIKLMPHILAWAAMLLILVRGCASQRHAVAFVGCAGFSCGLATALVLARVCIGNSSFDITKMVLGAGFLLFCGIAVTAIYKSTGRSTAMTWGERLICSPLWAPVAAFVVGLLGGTICGFRFNTEDSAVVIFAALTVFMLLLIQLILQLERKLPNVFVVTPTSLISAISGLVLFSSSSILRLDLFSPLTMKVMKFAHDFVHQFFESMLIPDHLFFSAALWNYIGFLFGNGVGFWGALIVWLTPAVLVIIAIRFKPLPTVAHVRMGARRRKLVAEAISVRRKKLVVPFCALLFFGGAIYQSKFPSVEYWDPKPLTVSASPSGDIFIPKKGSVDLEDGKLHKYLFKQGGEGARFFIIMTPAGTLTAVLDACSICKPDGYGQSEGTVVCYYCKTLIPLETVGKPGGCNPVPIPVKVKDDGVHIDALTLINLWGNTVQATVRVKGEEK